MNVLARELAKIKKQITTAAEGLEEISSLIVESNQPADGERPFITEEELARMFRKHLSTVQRWRREGKLDTFYRKGRVYYWKREDLPDVLAKNGGEVTTSKK